MAWWRQLSEGFSNPLTDSFEAHALERTDGASLPFWSPDGRSIAYFLKGDLYRLDVPDGSPTLLATVGMASFGSWGRSGVILFSARAGTGAPGIFRVAASGGTRQPVVTGKSFTQVSAPQFLPDGKHFLFSAVAASPDASGIYVASIGGGDPRLLLRVQGRVWYAAPGYLLFLRNGTLMAQPFDAETIELSGEPAAVAQNVEVNRISESAILTIADNGTLVYETPTPLDDRIVWYDRTGNTVAVTGTPGNWGTPSISPDGRRLAISYNDPMTASKPDIWVYDLERGVKTRVTLEGGINADAFWSPDNGHVCFVTNGHGRAFRIYSKAADGTGAATPVVYEEDEDAAEFFGSWSADGHYLAWQRTTGSRVASNSGPATGEIWAVQTSGDQKPFPVVQNGQFAAIQPALSPDAKWLAYVSEESGQAEVYVVPFPHGTGKYVASSGGGTWPRWSHDGKELFYWQGHALMTAQTHATNGGLTIGADERLLEADPAPGGLGPMYDVSADGTRVVIVTRDAAATAKPLMMVLNWPALLRRR